MRKLGIIFLHHEITAVVKQNLRSVRRANPAATVVTIGSGVPLPGGYTLRATPDLQELFELDSHNGDDWLVCSWYEQRRERCAKWWIIKADVRCRMPVEEFYGPVWEFPFVVSAVHLRYREPRWHGWDMRARVPKAYQPFMTGAEPFLYLARYVRT
jgi:hypothetical protein